MSDWRRGGREREGDGEARSGGEVTGDDREEEEVSTSTLAPSSLILFFAKSLTYMSLWEHTQHTLLNTVYHTTHTLFLFANTHSL